MALQSFTVSIGALRDVNNNDKNYVSGEAIYVKTIGGSFAPIFRDLAGASEIAQDGLANQTDDNGQFTFFVEAGDYILEYQNQSTPVTVVGSDYFNSRIEESVNQIIIETSSSRGFRVVGDFAGGFTYELPNDVAIDVSGSYWVYADVNALPVVITAGTTPSSPTYTQVTFNQASGVTTTAGINAQQFIDNFELKIFQSPTDNLTKIEAFAGGVGVVYEVRNYYDGSLAKIYADKNKVLEIDQNGTSNISGSNAECVFYIENGEFYVTIGGLSKNFSVLKNTNLIQSSKADSLNAGNENTRVALVKNRVGANQDSHIMLFGDSHSWGQGAPGWDNFVSFSNYSTHSAAIFNNGFMARIESYINNKFNWDTGRYGGGTSQLSTFVTDEQVLNRNNGDPENAKPINIKGGNITLKDEPYLSGLRAQPEWYTPLCKGDAYSENQYREKVAKGLFDLGVTRLEKCSALTFNPEGKNRFWEITPNPNSVAYGGSFEDLIYSNGVPSGDVYLGTKDPTSQRVFVNSSSPKPDWVVDNGDCFIPGYGYAKFGSSLATNDSIQIKAPNGDAAGVSLAKLIAPGTKIYPKSAAAGLLTIDMQSPARVIYVSVISQAGGGKMRFDFTPNITSGFSPLSNTDTSAGVDNKANKYSWEFPTGNNAALLVNSNGALTSTSYVSVDGAGFTIDTDNTPDGGAKEEYLFRIDLGGRMQGRINMYLADVASDFVEFRGVVFDNNKVANFAMGGHTIGGWLGDEASFNDPARDHVADILNYTPVQPSVVITQIPFVNEYLRQTPIATFKSRLQDFVDRFENHLVPGASTNYNLVGVDFAFFTSLRNKEIAFEGAVSDPITYDDYVQATIEFCQDNNHAFIDCEKKLFDMVYSGDVVYDRLFNNSNHPSDYANEVIFNELKNTYLDLIV